MTDIRTRVIAIDWSGKKGAAESIWQAEAVAGQIVQLENGYSREALVTRLNTTAEQHPRLIAGFDVAFSMPSWFVQQHQPTHAAGFWSIVATDGESWLNTCPLPFSGWREPHGQNPNCYDRQRRTLQGPSLSSRPTVQARLVSAPSAACPICCN